jgi:hypothetical protein
VILATQEAEIRRITVQSQSGQKVHKTLPQKNPSQKNWAGGVAQGEGPEFKPQHGGKKKKKKEMRDKYHTPPAHSATDMNDPFRGRQQSPGWSPRKAGAWWEGREAAFCWWLEAGLLLTAIPRG